MVRSGPRRWLRWLPTIAVALLFLLPLGQGGGGCDVPVEGGTCSQGTLSAGTWWVWAPLLDRPYLGPITILLGAVVTAGAAAITWRVTHRHGR